jgi:hypothetical protein
MRTVKAVMLILVCVSVLGAGLIGLGLQRARAQELDCNFFEEEIRAKLDEALEADDPLEGIRVYRQYLFQLEAECRQFSFSRTIDGRNPELGPLEFDDGLWRVTFTSTGPGAISFTPLEGDCDEDKTVLNPLINVFYDDATDGAQATFRTEGCKTMVSVGNTSRDWTVTFDLIRPR